MAAVDRPSSPPDEGTDPDPRFSFANERTFLAWSRTALALIAGGLAVSQLLKVGSDVAPLVVALALIAFGAFMSYTGYQNWRRNEQALRLGHAVPPSALPRILALGIACFSVAAVVLAFMRLLQ
jgi:putative membrane protein